MNYVNYTMDRWYISYGAYEGIQAYAADEVYAMVRKHVPYILTMEGGTAMRPEDTDGHILMIGTAENHPYIRAAIDKGWLTKQTAAEGYSIRLGDSPFRSGSKLCIIQGADASGVLYGVRDFEHFYEQALRFRGYHYNVRFRPFVEEMPDFEKFSAPKVESRGIWMWGHTMHAYPAFFDNMTRYKLNTIVLWNDHAPINGAEIVRYAHARGIRVIWGYTWCWGEQVDPHDADQRKHWEDYAVQVYRTQYQHLGGDGIYFQMFTETHEKTIGDLRIADLALLWTNQIAARMHREFPGLWIQFGVHATSIGQDFRTFADILPDVSIVWEDAGSFPYHYDPRNQDSFEETLAYTEQIAALRGENERFGAVLKGYNVLNWTQFEHQLGHVLNGVSSASERAVREQEARFAWRFALPYWTVYAERMRRICHAIQTSGAKDRTLTMLVEQGMLECGIRLPVALSAELLWDADRDVGELLIALHHCPDIVFD